MSNVIEATLSTGSVLPFRPATAKSGNAYHAILDPANGKPAGRYGVNVHASVIGKTLPKTITVLGTKVSLEAGTTDSGNPKVSAANVPVKLNDEARMLNVRISKTARGFNVAGSISRPGAGGGRAPVTQL